MDHDDADDDQIEGDPVIALGPSNVQNDAANASSRKRRRGEEEIPGALNDQSEDGHVERNRRSRLNSSTIVDQENRQMILPNTSASIQNQGMDGSVPIDQIQQLFTNLQKKNEEQFKHLNRKLELKLRSGKFDFNSYRDASENSRVDSVMYNSINLTQLIARDPAHFSRQILRLLFTIDELSDSLLPDRPSDIRKHYSKQPLDEKRYEILHRALKAKYGIGDSKYDDFYEKCVRRSLIDLLQSCRRKRKKTRNVTAIIDELPMNEFQLSPLSQSIFSPTLDPAE